MAGFLPGVHHQTQEGMKPLSAGRQLSTIGANNLSMEDQSISGQLSALDWSIHLVADCTPETRLINIPAFVSLGGPHRSCIEAVMRYDCSYGKDCSSRVAYSLRLTPPLGHSAEVFSLGFEFGLFYVWSLQRI